MTAAEPKPGADPQTGGEPAVTPPGRMAMSLAPARPRPPTAQPAFSVLHIENLGDEMRVYWRDGHVSHYLAVWLREAWQRLQTSRRAALDASPLPTVPLANGRFDAFCEPDRIQVHGVRLLGEDQIELRFAPEDSTACFPVDWLRQHSYDDWNRPAAPHRGWPVPFEPPTAELDALLDDPTQTRRWLDQARVTGIALLRNLPCDHGLARHVCRHLGLGDSHDLEFPSTPDTAARPALPPTSRTLHAYRRPVPGWLAMHVQALADDTASLYLVDGAQAASELKAQCPAYFEILCRHPVPYAGADNQASYRSHHRIIETGPRGEPRVICHAPDQMTDLDLSPNIMRDFYRAYRRWQAVVRRKQIAVRIEAGDLWLIDNHRVLHAALGSSRLDYQGIAADRLDARIRALDEQARR
ncbi:MAG: TauD/TfdA family dioxygenase [Gammaproteobacteria bacterium]|nr:TauD/TfdA family dioxygenase [Gammaproteobacteria bacterium]